MNNNYIIRNAYTYYDQKMRKFEQDFNLTKQIKFEEILLGSDSIRSVLRFKDLDNKVLFDAEFEIIGIKYPIKNKKKTFLWVWGWAHPQLKKNNTLLSKKLLKYGLDIPKSQNNINMFIKSILTNSRMEINRIEANLIEALSLYLTKKEAIRTFFFNENGIKHEQIMILTNISKNNTI